MTLAGAETSLHLSGRGGRSVPKDVIKIKTKRLFDMRQFKAQVVQGYLQPGATTSRLAINHRINFNLIGKGLPIYQDQSPATPPAFVAASRR
jgi:hypothetical protein